MQRGDVLAGIEDHDPALFGAGDLEVPVADPLVEGEPHALEGIEPAAADSGHARRGVEIEQERQIRHHPSGREGIEVADGLEIHPCPKP